MDPLSHPVSPLSQAQPNNLTKYSTRKQHANQLDAAIAGNDSSHLDRTFAPINQPATNNPNEHPSLAQSDLDAADIRLNDHGNSRHAEGDVGYPLAPNVAEGPLSRMPMTIGSSFVDVANSSITGRQDGEARHGAAGPRCSAWP